MATPPYCPTILRPPPERLLLMSDGRRVFELLILDPERDSPVLREDVGSIMGFLAKGS